MKRTLNALTLLSLIAAACLTTGCRSHDRTVEHDRVIVHDRDEHRHHHWE